MNHECRRLPTCLYTGPRCRAASLPTSVTAVYIISTSWTPAPSSAASANGNSTHTGQSLSVTLLYNNRPIPSQQHRPVNHTVKLTMTSTWWNVRHSSPRMTTQLSMSQLLETSVGFRSWSPSSAISPRVTEAINPAVGCHSFAPGPRLPPQPPRITAHCPVPNYTRVSQYFFLQTAILQPIFSRCINELKPQVDEQHPTVASIPRGRGGRSPPQ